MFWPYGAQIKTEAARKKIINRKAPASPPGKDESSAARKTRTVWSQKAASEQGEAFYKFSIE